MRFGVHVSIGKGLPTAVNEAASLGCDGFQIFAGNPRGWARTPLPSGDIAAFKKRRQELKLGPVMVHLSYLPNPASTDPELYQKSLANLKEDYFRATQLEADFFVFHPGKSKGTSKEDGIVRVAGAVNQVLAEVSGGTYLLFENQAGGGNEIAADFADLGSLIAKVDQKERVGVCFDTCHAFAAGYDVSSTAGWESIIDSFDKQIGLSYLKIFHLNDSMGERGRHLDRHQHIGAGAIGLEGFRYLLNHPELSKRAGILETPQKEAGDDRRNLATLRSLIKES